MSTPTAKKPIKIVELAFPITHDNVEISSISIKRRALGRDVIDLSKRHKDPVDFQLYLLVNLTEMEPEVFRLMDATDFSKLIEELEDFLTPAPKPTSEPAS